MPRVRRVPRHAEERERSALSQKTAQTPLVSLVIPVYNSMPYLVETLDAIATQGPDEEQLEVIPVDDGSDDGSEKVLAEYAERHPNYRLITQPNSGGPADPCNKGIAAVTGKCFFVAGSDDVLTEGALADLAAYAEKHGSDIVLAKMAGLNGRHTPGSMFRRTKADAHLVEDRLFNSLISSSWSVGPCRLLEEEPAPPKLRRMRRIIRARARRLAYRARTPRHRR